MKKLIFLFLGFFCFANSQVDSMRIVQKLEQLDQVNNQNRMLFKKADVIDKQNQSLIFKIKIYIQKLRVQNKFTETKLVTERLNSYEAVKPSNINEPITEVIVPDGYDTIKGSFFYRLFHKEKTFLKAYKIQGDEKIYMD